MHGQKNIKIWGNSVSSYCSRSRRSYVRVVVKLQSFLTVLM